MRLTIKQFHFSLKYLTIMILLGMLLASCGSPAADMDYPVDSIEARLEEIRSEYNLPALGAALIEGDEITQVGVVGVRKLRDDTLATVDDKFHIGSCTKSMTATLAALLVQEGIIDWNVTVVEAFPEFGEQIHPQIRDMTLEVLLTQRSGLLPLTSPNDDKDLWNRLTNPEGNPVEERYWLAQEVLSREPLTEPGKEYAYSNTNYVVVGAMMENITGTPWEELVRNYLFEPLEIRSAGTGAPATPGVIDQPWGHLSMLGIRIPIEGGPKADNPAALGPAGTVHLSMDDFAKYVRMHLATLEGRQSMLSDETAEKLYTAQSESGYAMGWINMDDPRAGGRVVWHDGSNSMFYAMMVMAPELDRAVVVATNVGDAKAEEALTKVIEELLTR